MLIKRFRSRINSLPIDARMAIGELPYQIGMRPSSRKNKCMEILDHYNINYKEVGTGTNRFIVKYEGYALKIALDDEGLADNKQEYAICDRLMPDVPYTHEISRGGLMMVSQYAPAFTSQREMNYYRSEIVDILQRFSKVMLLGDVGLNKYNYANWGLLNNRPVCIDSAYLFPADMNLFKCICGNTNMQIDSTYTTYSCPICHHQYEDRELRSRISTDLRIRLFNSVDGIFMKEPFEEHEVDDKYIVVDDNPLRPDILESVSHVYNKLNGIPDPYWDIV